MKLFLEILRFGRHLTLACVAALVIAYGCHALIANVFPADPPPTGITVRSGAFERTFTTAVFLECRYGMVTEAVPLSDAMVVHCVKTAGAQ